MDDVCLTQLQVMRPLPTGMLPSGQTRSALKAILFDIYGTLFISGSGDIGVSEERFQRSEALNALCERYHIPWSPEQMARKLFAAIKDAHTQKKMAGTDYPEVEIDRIWQGILGWPRMERVRRWAQAYECIVNPTFPMPGLDHVLRTLRGRGVPMGIISNAQFFTPRLFNTYLGATPESLGFCAELSLYSFRFGCAKPSMVLFDHAVSRLREQSIAPETVLYVGNDMRNDIQTAGRAGFQTALFAGDRRSLRLYADDPAIQSRPPDLVLTGLRQLLDPDMITLDPPA